MSFIDEIISPKELLSIKVPEWKDKIIYFYPFSLADTDHANKMSKGKDGEFIAYTIIRKSLDEEGNKLFTVADKVKLMNNFDPELLSRIVIDMKGDDEESSSGKL